MRHPIPHQVDERQRAAASSPKALAEFRDAEDMVRVSERAHGGRALPVDHPAMVNVRAAHAVAFPIVLPVAAYISRHPKATESVTTLGPTAYALAAIDTEAAGARLVIRSGDARTGLATYTILPKKS